MTPSPLPSTNGERFALEWAWWAWNHPDIHRALMHGLVRHAVPVIDAALQANRAARRMPSSWTQLGDPDKLRRNERNVRRAKAGEIEITYPLLLGLAAILQVPVERLLPKTSDWLAAAATALCGTLTASEACAYARYRTGEFDKVDLLIRSAAKKLAPVLEAIDAEMLRRER